ncbi:MAG: hypothetical protein V3U75_09320 [Methylococcaceae bacterium]
MHIKNNFVTVSLILGASVTGPVIASPANLCETRVTDRNARIVEKIAKPAYLETYQDPAFGTSVTRISNTQHGGVIKTMYNTIQAWNADESKLILYHTGTEGAGHHLYDGQTYEHIRKLDIVPPDLEEVFWDPKSADHLFYIQKYPVTDEFYDTLVRYNVNTEEKQKIADMGEVCGHPPRSGGSATSGSDVQAMYGDHIGVRCNNNAFDDNTTDQTFFVNVRTGAVSNQVVIDPSQPVAGNTFGYANNISASPTPSNQRILLQGSVFDTNMNLLHNLDISYSGFLGADGNSYTVPKPEHNTVGRLPNGHDTMFSVIYNPSELGCNGDPGLGVGSLVSFDMETGACRVIVGQSNGWGYPQSGTHVSAISEANPGWVVISTIGYGHYDYFDNGEEAPLLFSEISLTYAGEEPKTCRLAHARTYAKDAQNTSGYNAGYFGEPHPVISPSGTRVIFSSDWYDSGSVDTYVIDLEESGNIPSPVPNDPQTPETNPQPAQPLPVVENNQGDEQIAIGQPTYNYGEKIQVDFSGLIISGNHRITIAPVGSPDAQLKMWLYTNGTQKVSETSPSSGTVSFLSQYVGVGQFEARLFANESEVATVRKLFDVTQ